MLDYKEKIRFSSFSWQWVCPSLSADKRAIYVCNTTISGITLLCRLIASQGICFVYLSEADSKHVCSLLQREAVIRARPRTRWTRPAFRRHCTLPTNFRVAPNLLNLTWNIHRLKLCNNEIQNQLQIGVTNTAAQVAQHTGIISKYRQNVGC